MSYELVSGLKIDSDKVMIKSVSNNVSPRVPRWQEYPYFTRLLKEKGKEAVIIGLLHSYEEGNLQPGVENKYSRAISRLRKMPEYSAFNWRMGGLEKSEQDINRETKKEEFDKLLLLSFNTKDPTDKFTLTKLGRHGETLFGKVMRKCIQWWPDKSRATIYKYKVDAENLKKCYTGSDDWQVISL